MIEVRNITFAYNGKSPLFQDFSWKALDGEAWAIIGPSGSGKSTLLYLLAGLRRPQRGLIQIGGIALQKPRRQTGLILQDYGLLPWATARENAALGLVLRHEPTEYRDRVTSQWLERLGLASVSNQYPQQLSGGQRQRVAVARTLAIEPDLLLMDEPFSSLDALTREEMQDLVIDLGIEGRITSILVTHSIEEAAFLGRKILILPAPPISSARILDNPEAGQRGYRTSAAYLHQCGEIRTMVEEIRYGG
jgi:NitT/TauT family transport system ATP-binding protein